MRRPLATLLTTALIGSGLAVALPSPASAAPGGPLAYGLLGSTQLVSFRVNAPGTASAPATITGLQAAETVLGIDVRPATGELFALGSTGRVYVINPTTAAATSVTTGSPVVLDGAAASWDIDFNPTVDRLRVVNDVDDNLRLNPVNGALAGTDTDLAYATTDVQAATNPTVTAAAYLNNNAGATSTLLYDLDTGLNQLALQGNPNPNGGVLTSSGFLGVDAGNVAGFDIDGLDGTGYAVLSVGGVEGLYTISTGSGAATLVGATVVGLTDLTIATPRFKVTSVSVAEGSAATVTVTRFGDLTDAAKVDYATSDGTATAGTDYTATSGQLNFAAGDTSKTFSLPTTTDLAVEGAETVTVTLTNATGGTALSPGVATVTVTESSVGYALTTDNKIGTFALSTPGAFTSTLDITGTGGADVVGIDVRPATGGLYALTADSKLYTLDPATGVATLASTLSTPLSGTAFGVDFNPVPDRLRITSDAEQNLRVNVDTGAATVDGKINTDGDTVTGTAASEVIGAAYTNSFGGATVTTLYTVDSTADTLNIQNPPNNGTQTSPLPLGVNIGTGSDLDITPAGTTAFGAFGSTLYRVNLTTGVASSLGAFAVGTVEDLALPSPGRLGLSSATATVAEGVGNLTVTVNRTAGNSGPVGITYTAVDGLAVAGSDYTATTGTLAFADGETGKTFTVPITQDTAGEGPEKLSVVLSSPTGGAGTVTTTQVVTITDDDATKAYGLTTDNYVVTFDPTNPTASPSASAQIAGLAAGEDLLGLDYRPADNRVYTISSLGKVYALDPTTGATSYISTSSTLPSGTAFGVDVNPVADRLRVVSDSGQSLRINIDTGAATVDGSLSYATGDSGQGATPAVAAAGYTNSATGQSATALYDVDPGRDVLVLQNPPNSGTLTTVGALGLDSTSVAGLDIGFPGNNAFAVLRPAGGASSSYRIDLATGAASLLGALSTTTLEDLTLVTGTLAALPTPTPTPTPTASPTPTATATGQAGGYHALPPSRLLDTRNTGPSLAGGTDRTFVVAGKAGVPASGVSAVVLNVTVTGSSTRGNLQLYPAGAKPAQRTSNLNFAKGQQLAVQVQVGLGTGGAVGVFLNSGSADLVIDVLGWYGDGSDTSGLGYQALTPTRLLDTRTTTAGTLKAGTPRQQQVTGKAGVPAGATAVALNVTATDASQTLNVALFPGGTTPAQRTSTINVTKGQTIANAAVVTLAADGSLAMSVSAGSVSLVLDVVGYYGAGATSRFTPITPVRLLDTRTAAGGGVIKPGADRAVKVTGVGGVPGNASAAVLTVTGTQTLNHPWLQVYPTGVNAPRTSTLNLLQGADIANLAVTKLGNNGRASLRISQFFSHAVVDVTGYFS